MLRRGPWSRTGSILEVDGGNCPVVPRPIQLPAPVGPVKNEVPNSIRARRLTSAIRTCSITCCASLPPGTWSMLMTFAFGDAARTTSAIRSITCVLDARPVSTMPSALVVTWTFSSGKQPVQLLLERGDRLLDDDVVLQTLLSPHRIRLIVPAALPSMRISRGRTTVASAISGLVTAMRVTSKSVDDDGRASGRDRDLRHLTWLRLLRAESAPPPAASTSRETTPYASLDHLRASFGSANRFNRVDRGSEAESATACARPRGDLMGSMTGSGPVPRIRAARRMPFVSVEIDVERVAQRERDLSLVATARAMRSASSGNTASVTTEVGIGSPSFDFS